MFLYFRIFQKMKFSGYNINKFLIIFILQEMKLSGSNIKKIMLFSYFSGNENDPKN